MKKYFLILAFATALAVPSLAHPADIAVVSSEGTSARSDDLAEVKRKAVEKALKGAVADSVNSILSRESLAAPDAVMQELTSEPMPFVLNYKVRSEGWITHMDLVPASVGGGSESSAAGVELYHIWLDVSVDKDALRRAVTGHMAVNASTGPLVINILDVRDYPTFKKLFAALQRVAVIKDLSYNSFSSGRITLLAGTSGSASQIAARIAREVPGTFVVVEGAGQIIIRPSEGLTIE